MRVLIVGCGYIGLPLGAELVRQGHAVFGLKRSVDDAELKAAGITPLHADITRAETLTGLPSEYDWVVNCTASGGGDAEAYRQLYLMGNRNLIEWLRPSPPRRYVYTSSTSVYGQNDGSLVVETDPIAPATDTSQILVATENLLLAAAMHIKFPTVILRLAGIYGPGRVPFLDKLCNAEPIPARATGFLNLIHVDDAAAIVMAGMVATHGVVAECIQTFDQRQRDLVEGPAVRVIGQLRDDDREARHPACLTRRGWRRATRSIR